MARRKSEGMAINLFPFLSILVCIIGCLTMIIVVLNIAQMDQVEGQTPEEVERAREWQELQADQEKNRKKLEEEKKKAEEMIQQNRDTIAKRDKLQLLKNMLENQEEIDESRDKLIKEYRDLTNSVEELDKTIVDINKEIEEKQKLIAQYDLPPDPPKLKIVSPSGSGKGVKPKFVEAASKGLFYHHSLTEDPKPIAVGGLAKSEVFQDLLKEVSGDGSKRLIFLVRGNSESTKSFLSAAKAINDYNYQNYGKPRFREITPGRLPVLADGKIDLGDFAEFFPK